MSVREEDRKKNSCTSRGLGVAAAAIGVGVGAALYYYFSKREENPHGEGSTSGWNNSQEQALPQDSDNYTTVSEHSTTDTSVHDSTSNESGNDSDHSIILIDSDDSCSDCSSSQSEDDDSNTQSDSDRMSTSSNDTNDPLSDFVTRMNESTDLLADESVEHSVFRTHLNNTTINSDLESEGEMEWDVTNVSTDVPSEFRSNRLIQFIDSLSNVISPRLNFRNERRAQEDRDLNRAKAFRERSWSLEECSICFDVILKDQKVTTLACTHHFHSACIEPWLNEQQTCPNCRKQAQ